MKVLIKSAWGSADPTQATFPFHHANAFAEAGHQVQVFLLGEAVPLMRPAVASAVVPVGWAPLAESPREADRASRPDPRLRRLLEGRGVLPDDLEGKNASFSDPAKFVALVEWADKILTE